jgi:glycosyltransferase involved in cell wall biosynthesis
LLSIIIPAFDEENRLPDTLERLIEYLRAQPYQAELLIIDNASQDRTFEIAQTYADNCGRWDIPVRVYQEPLRGKGAAVRTGMLKATGEYRFMCDADLSMPVSEINRFLPPTLNGADIAIASREAPGAVRYGEPAYRHLVGRVFNWLIRLLALPSLHDTQCGFKCFKASVAEDLFSKLTITGWSFDVEVLYIARRRGYRIAELPIPWHYNPQSRISVLRDSLQMFLDILKIRLNGARGRYDRQQ